MDHLITALAEPIRRDMLDLLAERPHSAGEVERRLGLSQPMASRHLRVLREAGLAQVTKRAQSRIYRLNPAPLAALDAWLARYRAFWPGALDALAEHLNKEV